MKCLGKGIEMTSCMPDLVASLNAKRSELEELLDLTKQEQRCIIDIDLAGLETLDLRKRELLLSMERTSAEFRNLLKIASQEFQVGQADSLSLLLPKVTPPLRATLKGIQAKLFELGESLNRALEFNKVLLNGSLEHVHSSINFLRSFFTTPATYGQAGGMVKSSEEVRLVCKEI